MKKGMGLNALVGIKMFTIEKIKNMSNEALLELYTKKVRYDHYDPVSTPSDMVALDKAQISQDDLFSEILSRMK